MKIDTTFSAPVGSHEWQVWRVHLYDFAQLVFNLVLQTIEIH